MIKICAAEKLQLNRGPEDLALVEVKSNGERTIFKDVSWVNKSLVSCCAIAFLIYRMT